MRLIVFFYIKIYRAIHFISEPKIDQFFGDVNFARQYGQWLKVQCWAAKY